MPRQIKNSLSVNGLILDPLSFALASCTISFNLTTLDFQFLDNKKKTEDGGENTKIKTKKKQARQTYSEGEFEKQMSN